VLSVCDRLGLAFIPFFPLASGLLTGKYRRGMPPPANTRLAQSWAATRFLSDERLTVVDALGRFAKSRGHSLLELAMSWTAHRPAVASVIAGATTPEQVHANAQAAGWQITDSDLVEIDRLAPPAEAW
jgi:aryl-alcohol dehydrogenase-like predicted oxidoreductase